MKSMTGYGRGMAAGGGCRVTVELSSVNRRQAEVALSLPRELEPLEARVREQLSRGVARGRVTARVALQVTEVSDGACRLNVPLARAYAREFRRLIEHLDLAGEVTLDNLLRAPGVLQAQESLADGELYWPVVREALDKAMEGLMGMRRREGAHLERELKRRIAAIQAGVRRVRRLAPAVQKRCREQLRERVRQAGLETPAPDDERLLKELVYYADRSDVTEELTRLDSHVSQFAECLKSGDPVGRTLDFLAQEMNREVNTVGSKANDSRISREVVGLKTELEKFREQVQNVE
jgi:uncharacterized protein (TIGR00255 family)